MNICDRTIKKMMPELFPPDMGENSSIDFDKQIQPSTIDLRLGRVFWEMRRTLYNKHLDPIDPRTSDPLRYFDKTEADTFELLPGGFVLAQTMEFISVPENMVAFVDGRSSYGRWGLRIHSTAGLIDAGFRGIITLEIAMDSAFPMILHAGDRICQVRFELLDEKCEKPYGPERSSKYHGQSATQLSRSALDTSS